MEMPPPPMETTIARACPAVLDAAIAGSERRDILGLPTKRILGSCSLLDVTL